MAEKKVSRRVNEHLAKILARTPEPEKLSELESSQPLVFQDQGGDLQSYDGKEIKPLGVTVQEVVEAQEALNQKTVIAAGDQDDPSLADRVGIALDVIQRAINQGFKFTDAQRDVGINMSINCLPESEQEWFLEICEKMCLIPRWQGLWGQFRRCHEWGMANAPMLDPGWEIGEMGPLEPRECEWCHATYTPTDRKQDVCSNRCGGQKELARLGLNAQQAEAAVHSEAGRDAGDPDTLENLEKEAPAESAPTIPDLPPMPAGPEV